MYRRKPQTSDPPDSPPEEETRPESETNDGKSSAAASGYKVIVPSPSKRMVALRKDKKSEISKREFRAEVTGENQKEMTAYKWPPCPYPEREWSEVQKTSAESLRIVDDFEVSMPADCHHPELADVDPDLWLLHGNPSKKGVCGSGDERDIERYGKVGDFEIGDLLLVPDPKKNQLYDGGWYTGEEITLPKPYGRCVRLQWADLRGYGGSDMDFNAWRPVYVPVSRIIKAPTHTRALANIENKRCGEKEKLTMDQLAKYTLQSDVYFQDESAYALYAKNRRENAVWGRQVKNDHKLLGTEDQLVCYYVDDLDKMDEANKLLAGKHKKILKADRAREEQSKRRADLKKHRTEVSSQLTNQLAAPSVGSSPARSVATASQAKQSTGDEIPAIEYYRNQELFLHALSTGTLPPRPPPLSLEPVEFWKTEALTLLQDTKGVYDRLCSLFKQIESSQANIATINDTVNRGVMANMELLMKNKEMAQTNALNSSNLTAMLRMVAAKSGYQLNTMTAALSPQDFVLPETSAYIGPALTRALTGGTPLSFSTIPVASTPEASPQVTGLPRNSVSGPAEVSKFAVVDKKTTVFRPSRPKEPWSEIEHSLTLYFQDSNPSWELARKNAILRLERPLTADELTAVRWLYWNDEKFDAYSIFKQSETFCKLLNKIIREGDKSEGKGLDKLSINSFLHKRSGSKSLTTPLNSPAPVKEGSRSSAGSKQSTPARAIDAGSLPVDSKSTPLRTKAEQKVSAQVAAEPPPKKRGQKAGEKRKTMDRKLKETWSGKGNSIAYNTSFKKIWSAEQIEAACKVVRSKSMQNKPKVHKMYRFVTTLLKCMAVNHLSPSVLDLEDLKHALISLRTDIKRTPGSSWFVQEQVCRMYAFFWAAVELFRDNFTHFFPKAEAENLILGLVTDCAGLCKSWCTLAAGAPPPTKEAKLAVPTTPKERSPSPEKTSALDSEVIASPQQPEPEPDTNGKGQEGQKDNENGEKTKESVEEGKEQNDDPMAMAEEEVILVEPDKVDPLESAEVTEPLVEAPEAEIRDNVADSASKQEPKPKEVIPEVLDDMPEEAVVDLNEDDFNFESDDSIPLKAVPDSD